jgi:hypothetical protein
MIRSILVICGLAASVIGAWQTSVHAREAFAAAAHAGDPTRAALEASRPLLARTRVRRVIRGAASSILWLIIALYGLLLIGIAGTLPVLLP